VAIRGFAFGTIEAATEPNAFTPDVAAPTAHETRVTRGRDLKAEVRQRRLAALRPLLGELQVGLQERPGARKRSVGLIELRRGRLKDVGHSRRDVQLDGEVGGSRCGGEARRVIQQDLVRTGLDEKRCDPAQIGEQRTERGGRRIGAPA
jgi:hypothetical protein